MIITSKIKMDLSLWSVAPPVNAVQDDKYSRNLEVSLYSNNVAWEPPSGTTAIVRYRKADGTGGNYDALPDGTAACSFNGNVLTVALAPQVLTAPGRVMLAVGLICGDAEINTFAVRIDVQPNPGIDVVSEDYTNVRNGVPASGWTPNMYLGTDDAGNVIAVEAPEGGSGAQATAISMVRDGSTITVTTTLEDGGTSTSVVTLDADDYPVTIVTDGVECAVSWEGFDSE